MHDGLRGALQLTAEHRTRALDWSDDPGVFALYLAALRDVGLWFSRDSLERMIYAAHVGVAGNYGDLREAFPVADLLTLEQRRSVVALTWPVPFEIPISRVDELTDRTAQSLMRDIVVNFASVAWRWSLQVPPEVDGRAVELGEALTTLGPREGITPALVRRLLSGEGAVVCLDELLDITRTLRMSFEPARPHTPTEIALQPPLHTLAAGDDAQPRPWWFVDAAALARDLHFERRIVTYHDEFAAEWDGQTPERIHALRIAPFGDPPAPGSRYYGLFRFLDQQTASQFRLTIEQLDEQFAQGAPSQARRSRSTKPPRRHLPPTARHQRGWWSNPKPSKQGQYTGLGGQGQRIAWRAAGYETTRVIVTENPRASKPSERLLVESVTFRAIPGRFLWHPFRERLRTPGATDPLMDQARDEAMLSSHGVEIRHWHDQVLAAALGEPFMHLR